MDASELRRALRDGGLPGLAELVEDVTAPRATLKKLGAAFVLTFEVMPGAGPTKVYLTAEGMRIINPASSDSEFQTLPDAIASIRSTIQDARTRADRLLGATAARPAAAPPARTSLAVESMARGRALVSGALGLPEITSHAEIAEACAQLRSVSSQLAGKPLPTWDSGRKTWSFSG